MQSAEHRREVRRKNAETWELAERRDIDALIDLLSNPLETANVSIRSSALMHLRKLGAREAIPCIVPLLHDRDPIVRAGAIVALTELRAADTAHHLIEALEDAHPGVRQRAVEGLATLRVDVAHTKDALLRALGDPEWNIRRSALEALADVGDATLTPAIAARVARERFWRRLFVRRILRKVERRS